MFDNVATEITINSVVDFSNLKRDQRYGRRLVNIEPVIKSGLEMCIRAKAFPIEQTEVTVTDGLLSQDCYEIYKVLKDGEEVPYTKLSRNKAAIKNGSYTVWYFPTATIDLEDFTSELALPSVVTSAIPYWVKGTLYEVDEVELAERAKSMFYEIIQSEDIGEDGASEMEMELSL